MAKIIYTTLLLILCFLQPVKANGDSTLRLRLTKKIDGNFSNFYIDNLSNVYVLNVSNQIKKLNNQFDSVGVFNDVKRFGNIFSIDVSNPLKVLVYYKDFATVIMLDRFLNNRNTIELRQQNLYQVKAIAQSYDNNIWLYDEVENKLKKIDETGKLLLESADFRLLFSEAMPPTTIVDNNGLLYLYNAKNGWQIFDYYGAIKNTYPILNWQHVQVNNKVLQGFDSLYMYTDEPKLLQHNQYKIPNNLRGFKKVIQRQNNFYFLTKTGVEIYTVY